jgi:hypothetical protein
MSDLSGTISHSAAAHRPSFWLVGANPLMRPLRKPLRPGSGVVKSSRGAAISGSPLGGGSGRGPVGPVRADAAGAVPALLLTSTGLAKLEDDR